MQEQNGQESRRPPVVIAPATVLGSNEYNSPPPMPYTCQSCARRKIKCDKASPKCTSCRKGSVECVYQAPPTRRKKRKLSGDGGERLARYEQILREHNLLPQEQEGETTATPTQQALQFFRSETSGKVVEQHGKPRYLNGNVWHHLREDDLHYLSDQDHEDEVDDAAGAFEVDPLTAAFMGSYLELSDYHPTAEYSMLLWKTHVTNVEPICKVLHIPSVDELVKRLSWQPGSASKSEECLLFAIYHFAVFSLDEGECLQRLQESKSVLLQRYQFAAKQALVNANFLKSRDMTILQSLILFLLPCRFTYDAEVFWILTGVAVRLSQRMGLHRDGKALGLAPFDVQMRRRLFFQLIPLDASAGQMTGTGIAIMPDTWDTLQPLNINDNQIWPGMTEDPEEPQAATDMIFCMTRSTLGLFFAKSGKLTIGNSSTDFRHSDEIIKKAEREVEEKYIRYCDIINPLHYLTIGLARSAISAMKVRVRLPKVRNGTATNADKKEIFQLALKVLDTDAAAYSNASLKKYLWHAKAFFAWGAWDSLMFVLNLLRDAGVLSQEDNNAAWERIQQVYTNHGEVLGAKKALHTIAIARLALKAWENSPPTFSLPVPAFITALREMGKRGSKKDLVSLPTTVETDGTPQTDPSSVSDTNDVFSTLAGNMGLDVGDDFNLESADWVFWENLIKDYQAQGG